MHLAAALENSFVLNFEDAASSWMEVCFFSAVDLHHISFYFGPEVGQRCTVSAQFFREGFSRNVTDAKALLHLHIRSRGNDRFKCNVASICD